MKKEMVMLIAAAMAAGTTTMAAATTTMAVATTTNGGSGGGGSSSSGRRHKPAYRKDKNGNNLPKCPHCSKPAMHKPNDCFSLPKNKEKMKTANLVDGKFVKKTE